MRLTITQRVLPVYRVPFFNQLRGRLDEESGTLSLVAGLPDDGEAIVDGSGSLGAVLVANRALPGSTWWQQGLVAAVQATRPDAVVIEANPRLVSNFALVAWCRLRRVPVVAWGAGKVNRHRSRVVDALSDLVLRLQLLGCQGAIGYGDVAAATFSRLGRRRLAVGVAPNATMAIDFESPPRLPPRGSRATFLFVGRLMEQKRVEVLIDAVEILSRTGLDCRLVVVGDGPQAGSLRARACTNPAVEFTGYCEADATRALMASAHALVLPGRGGLAVQEALACGLPVVAGPPTVAGDGTVHGLLEGSPAAVVAPEPTAASLAEAMRRIVDPKTWRDRSQAATELAVRHGGLDAMTDAFLDIVGQAR